mmetsp:Transcript_27920/g.52109  ORF Transcript_27920/g.52109 Transcript_27920/m.52109 type:complete len:117 (-) Transcript_27920:305-655(-)
MWAYKGRAMLEQKIDDGVSKSPLPGSPGTPVCVDACGSTCMLFFWPCVHCGSMIFWRMVTYRPHVRVCAHARAGSAEWRLYKHADRVRGASEFSSYAHYFKNTGWEMTRMMRRTVF